MAKFLPYWVENSQRFVIKKRFWDALASTEKAELKATCMERGIDFHIKPEKKPNKALGGNTWDEHKRINAEMRNKRISRKIARVINRVDWDQ